MTNFSKYRDNRVYLVDQDDYEYEVEMSLFDDGVEVGVYLNGPNAGVEFHLNSSQYREAMEAYENLGDYYYDEV
jgi:hypothetical protein